MTSQDDGEPKLWNARYVWSRSGRDGRGENDSDRSQQTDRNFRSYAADREHCATRFPRI